MNDGYSVMKLNSVADLPQEKMVCQNCNCREATENWVGEGGDLAYVHGMFYKWCKICCVEAQLKHARERAESIPVLEKELNDLLSEELKNERCND
jgi:hypothetical protein